MLFYRSKKTGIIVKAVASEDSNEIIFWDARKNSFALETAEFAKCYERVDLKSFPVLETPPIPSAVSEKAPLVAAASDGAKTIVQKKKNKGEQADA